jgi:hypothetical protein
MLSKGYAFGQLSTAFLTLVVEQVEPEAQDSVIRSYKLRITGGLSKGCAFGLLSTAFLTLVSCIVELEAQ